jgi:cysteinyl-tRNA synthetase
VYPETTMIKLYDTLRKKKVAFKPLHAGQVTMYNCGPTVYDYVHIGNLRSFLAADLLRRHLERRGYEVTQIMNITDVGHMLEDADEGEDKLEVAAAQAGQTPAEIAAFYTDAFFKDVRRLNLKEASTYPRASEHVDEMVALIEKLLDKGVAYKVPSPDGEGHSVYFDVAAFPDYGKLSGNTVEGLNPGARVEVRDDKKHPADFALWIYNPKHVMQWETPWGSGYPGWHLECSAMAQKYLGATIDIHTGGEDNKFPHHECEIAQSECATGQAFANYWLHVTHLMVEDQKMSKSQGNFFTLQDLLDKGYRSREVRYHLMAAQYRQQLNFTFTGLDGARSALARLDDFLDGVRAAEPEPKGRTVAWIKAAEKAFLQALDDDLNVPEALAALFDLVAEGNRRLADRSLTQKEQVALIESMEAAGRSLGFTFGNLVDDSNVPESVKALIEKRDAARADKNYSKADAIRDEIKAKGFVVEDRPEGRLIKRV